MKRISYIISKIDKALEFEWVVENLSADFEFTFILLGNKNTHISEFLKSHNILCHELKYSSKKDVFLTFIKVLFILIKTRPSIVHCHMFDATQIGLPASWLAGIKHRVYTRHHSSYNHVYHPHAVKYDKFSNYLSTKIVSISKNVTNILVNWENVPPKKIIYIPHGIDFELFNKTKRSERKRLVIKYDLDQKYPIVGVISRYTHWKGVQYIIPAFKKTLIKYPRAVLVLANAKQGDYKNEIQQLLGEIPKTNYREIEFEASVNVLYKCFDIFVHTPIDEHSEAFGQIYIEALAAGVPSIFTISGIAHDLINYNLAEIVEYKNSEEIYLALIKLINDFKDQSERSKRARNYVEKGFSLVNKLNRLKDLYNDCIC